MAERAPLLISLAAFGASAVLKQGQLHYTRLAREAGADGVELRAELLRDAEAELPALAATGLVAVYSDPAPLWRADDGGLNLAALEQGLARAAWLGARRLKMSIGGFDAERSRDSLHELRRRLAGEPRVELVIENDQTLRAGTLRALQRFSAEAETAGLDLGLVFDMGNWHWLGECPLRAAEAIGARVRYIHAKGVFRRPDRWVAVPLAESAAPWRAVLRALPQGQPWAIEYPLQGEDLVAVTRAELALLNETREIG
ncbi:sugar phosphate isomerase/epimerase [Roseateles sp. DAIF2]|uniref:sugar phosphate isomerase/epimerase family protein n=1 Tax=Roseateles sp. DAIF2 TaxID=2714952 RepID=UPI00201E1C06|nr:TIM barrel protein [Roseateles sp. DAIF2]